MARHGVDPHDRHRVQHWSYIALKVHRHCEEWGKLQGKIPALPRMFATAAEEFLLSALSVIELMEPRCKSEAKALTAPPLEAFKDLEVARKILPTMELDTLFRALSDILATVRYLRDGHRQELSMEAVQTAGVFFHELCKLGEENRAHQRLSDDYDDE